MKKQNHLLSIILFLFSVYPMWSAIGNMESETFKDLNNDVETALGPRAPTITDVFPADGDTLFTHIEYKIRATVTTEDSEGIDSVAVFFGLAPDMMLESSRLYLEGASYENTFETDDAVIYYGQVRAYGVNGTVTLGDIIEITVLSSATQIHKIYPSQDTLAHIGDSILLALNASVPIGSIDECNVLLSFDGLSIFQTAPLISASTNYYETKIELTTALHAYVAYMVIANGDTTITNYISLQVECGDIKEVTALAADEILNTGFNANWSSSEEDVSYLIDIWTIADGDTSYVVRDMGVNDTVYVASYLEEHTKYEYHVKVVTAFGCESEYSNAVAVTTGVVTGLQRPHDLAQVSSQPGLLKVSTSQLSDVEIYHISGALVVSDQIAADKRYRLKGGIYMVKVNEHIYKAIVP